MDVIARTSLGLLWGLLLSGCTAWCLPSSLNLSPQAEVRGLVRAPASWLEAGLEGGGELPAPDAELLWVDGQGQALAGGERVLSDEAGHFRLKPPAGLQAGWILARGVDGQGRPWRLVALAQVGVQGLQVDWSSTLAAARWQGLRGAQALPPPEAAPWAQAWASALRTQAEGPPAAPATPPVAAPLQGQVLPPDPAGVGPAPSAAPPTPPEAPAEVLDAFAPIYGGKRR